MTHKHIHSGGPDAACGCGHQHAAMQHGCSRPAHGALKISMASPLTPAADGACCMAIHDHDGVEEDADPHPLPPLASGRQRFSWRVEGMDCPSCARKIETAVAQISGVERAAVLFATQKLVVDAQQDLSPTIERAVRQAGFSLQAVGAKRAESAALRWHEVMPPIALALLMLLSYGLTLMDPSLGRVAFIATTLVGLAPIMLKAMRLMRSGSYFAIETLMSIAALGALFIGATQEAAMVLLLFMLGERLESYAANRARKGVSALMALVPDDAVVIEQERRRTLAVSALRPGMEIEVAPGGRLPADAELLQESVSFDESALTGESLPVDRQPGARVPAGALVVDRVCRLRVISQPGQNAIDRILQLIEEAEERRAPIERFLDRFSRYYTPAIMALALLVILIPPLAFAQPWDTWIYRGLTLLLIGCPCALVISTPAAITSGLAAASRHGALIKGGAALEQLGRVRTIAFDKTGTLTQGTPQVSGVFGVEGVSAERLLTLAAAVEVGSHHPLAKAVILACEQRGLPVVQAQARQAQAGIGVAGEVDGVAVQVAAPSRLAPETLSDALLTQIAAWEALGQTVVAVLLDGVAIGAIAMSDTLRPDAAEALDALRALGIEAVMLTGDNPRAAAAIAGSLGIDFRAGLLPQDKVHQVEALSRRADTAMVGDGINDAPAMKAASIGIAMGGGTDVALETADAALTHNRLIGLAQMIALSRATHANIRQNITLALGLKGVFLITSLLGITGLWLAVLADSGATALVTANALRLLRRR
ncbi:MAG: zinc/cadmium/mercury/lead-transporting ATPase [Edwardsiella sp. (in: enterobacteria)]